MQDGRPFRLRRTLVVEQQVDGGHEFSELARAAEIFSTLETSHTIPIQLVEALALELSEIYRAIDFRNPT